MNHSAGKHQQLTPAKSYAEWGYRHQVSQQFPQAIAHYQKALSLTPNWVEVRINLAIVYHRLGDWRHAIDEYQRVIVQKPDHVKACFNLAILYEKSGKFQEAERHYRLVIADQLDHVNAWIHLGSVLFHQGRYDGSLESFCQALQLQPDSAQILSNIGQVYFAQGQLEASIQSHLHAIALDPLLASPRLMLGRLGLQYQDYSKAQPHLQVLYEQKPTHWEANHDLGLIYVAQGDWSQALSYFRRVIAEQLDYIKLFCQRLKDCLPQDSYEIAQVACRDFLQTLHQDDELQSCLASLGRCYQYLGKALLQYGAFAQAEQYLHRALHLQVNSPELYELLGECLAKQNRMEAAIVILQMRLAIAPKGSQLTEPLQALLSRASYHQSEANPACLKTLALNAQKSTPVQRIFSSTKEWVEAVGSLPLAQPSFIELDCGDASPSGCLPKGNSNQDGSRCGGVTCQSCMSTLINLFSPQSIGENVFQCTMSQGATLIPTSTFVVKIPHGRAWIAPQRNDWLICKDIAILTEDQTLLADLSRFYPWYLPGCHHHDRAQHPILKSPESSPSQEVLGKVAVLSALSGHVYYHWMIDVLPRIGLLQRSGLKLEQIDGFVVNSLSKPFQRETLKILGIPLEKVIESDRTPHIQATELIVPSFPGHLDWVPRRTIEFLRSTFLPETVSTEPRRVYVSRSGAKYRQVVNETEVIKVLEQFGFVSLNLETFSVEQQAAIFSGAEAIVAPHGAALTNLVFCHEGTQVIELFSPNYVRTDYWMISQQLKLEHYYIVGKGFQGDFILKLMHQNALTEDMWIDPAALYLALTSAGLNRV